MTYALCDVIGCAQIIGCGPLDHVVPPSVQQVRLRARRGAHGAAIPPVRATVAPRKQQQQRHREQQTWGTRGTASLAQWYHWWCYFTHMRGFMVRVLFLTPPESSVHSL